MKRLVSVFMALAIILTSAFAEFPLTSVTAKAAGGVGIELGNQGKAVAWIKARGDEGWWEDVDGAYGCQCVDLIYAYYRYLGYPVPGHNAYDFANNSLDFWKADSGWYMDETPSPGAIVAWGANVYTGAGYGNASAYGHVGLVYSVSGSTIYTVETNGRSPFNGDPGVANALCRTRANPQNAKYIHPSFGNIASDVPHGSEMTSGAGYTISDGEYHIAAYKDSEYGVTVRDVSAADGANIDLWNDMHTKNHVFVVTYLNNGFYKIINKTTGKSLDVTGASTERGANVQQCTYNGSSAQQWSIESAGGGVYMIRAKCSGYYLDLADAAIAQGTNIQMYEKTDLYAQGWRFVRWITEEFVSGITTTSTENSITLKWGKVADATNYKLQQSINGTLQTIALPTETTYTVTGLKPDTEYTFCIYALNGNDQSYGYDLTVKTAEAKLTAVTGFKGTSTSSSVTLSWDKNSTADSYKIKQLVNDVWKDVVKTADNSTTTYTVNGLAAGTEYKFAIYAFKGTQFSTAAIITVRTAAAVPTAVTGFTGTATSNSVKLTWNQNSTADSYKIKRLVNGVWIDVVKTANNSTTSYTVSGLAENTEYKFAIYAFNGTQFSSAAIITVQTTTAKPTAVTGFKGTPTVNSVRLTWEQNSTADSYKIKQLVNGTWIDVVKTANNSVTAYTVSGLNADTEYQFAIYAFSGTQFSSAVIITVKTTSLKPTAVTGFSGAVARDYIVLSWNKNSTADSYKIKQLVNGAWINVVKTADNSTTKYTVSGLTPDTEYQFAIYAFSGSVFSDVAKLTIRTAG